MWYNDVDDMLQYARIWPRIQKSSGLEDFFFQVEGIVINYYYAHFQVFQALYYVI